MELMSIVLGTGLSEESLRHANFFVDMIMKRKENVCMVPCDATGASRLHSVISPYPDQYSQYKIIKLIRSIETYEPSGNCIEDVMGAMDCVDSCLQEESEVLSSKKVLLLTQLTDSGYKYSDDQILDVVSRINKSETKLAVIDITTQKQQAEQDVLNKILQDVNGLFYSFSEVKKEDFHRFVVTKIWRAEKSKDEPISGIDHIFDFIFGGKKDKSKQEKYCEVSIPTEEVQAVEEQNVKQSIDENKDEEPVPDEVAPDGGDAASFPIQGRSCSTSENPSNKKCSESEDREKVDIMAKEKLHRNVLNRCLPALVRNIDFQMVSMYMPQNKVIGEVHHLSEKKTESDKIRELIARIQEDDKDTYEEFKECLVKAEQSYLKDMLEEHEKIGTPRWTSELNVSLRDKKKRSATKIKESDKTPNTKGHVMISYSLAQKEKALWIKTQLENNGYSVWVVDENMQDSIADAMERAHVVLLCMSETYSSSVNCQKVALYRNGKRKVIIPLKMEDFTPHGFLESLVIDNIYYNFCAKSPFEDEMKKLLQELVSYYIKDLEEPKIVPFDIVLDDGVPVTRAEATPHIQVETSELSETIILLKIENQDVKMTKNNLEKALAAGQDDARALHIVDLIIEQGEEKLKQWLFMHLTNLLTKKMDSVEKHANYRIWPGTNLLSEREMTFVCLYKNKFDTTLKSFFKITILYKNIDELSPLIHYKNKEDLSWTLPTEEDALLIQSAIEEHGDVLFSEHSNLQVVCGGPFLLHERQQVVLKTPTIILYCHAKGYKPYGEKQFPQLLRFAGKDIPVDVREGYFALATSPKEWHDKLCMGISIGIKNNKNICGTLGPFVDMGDNEKGFITCAHVVVTEEKVVVQPADGDLRGNKTDEERICGRLHKWKFNPGFLDRRNGSVKAVLVDAALVKIEQRNFDCSSFPTIPEIDLKNMGLDPDVKLMYTNKVYTPNLPKSYEGKRVIKYGRTAELRIGQVDFQSAQVKIDNILMKYSMWNNEEFVIKGLYTIGGTRGKKFAEEGDSGAGIFTIDDNNKLKLTGLVTGVLNAAHDDRCLAQPMIYVLKHLEISRELKYERVST